MNGAQRRGPPPDQTQGHASPESALKRILVIGRFHRALPRAVEFLQHLLGRRTPGLDGPLQRLEVTGLVAAEMVETRAPAQARMRQRHALFGDLEQVVVTNAGLEANRGTSSRKAWRSGAFQCLTRSQAASRLTSSYNRPTQNAGSAGSRSHGTPSAPRISR